MNIWNKYLFLLITCTTIGLRCSETMRTITNDSKSRKEKNTVQQNRSQDLRESIIKNILPHLETTVVEHNSLFSIMQCTIGEIIDIVNAMRELKKQELLEKNEYLNLITNHFWQQGIIVLKKIIMENYPEVHRKTSYIGIIEITGQMLEMNQPTEDNQPVQLGKRKREMLEKKIPGQRIKQTFENQWHRNKKTRTAFEKLKKSVRKIDPKISLPVNYSLAIYNIYRCLACSLGPEKINSAVLSEQKKILDKNKKEKCPPIQKNEFALTYLEKLLNLDTSIANKEISERIDTITQKIEYKIAEKNNTQQIPNNTRIQEKP